MNVQIPLITKGTSLLFGAVGAGGILLMESATSYPQTFIVVIGEIIVACITGYCLIKVAQLKTHINSRMDELLELTAKNAKAEGIVEGKQVERAEVAAVAKGVADSNSQAKAI